MIKHSTLQNTWKGYKVWSNTWLCFNHDFRLIWKSHCSVSWSVQVLEDDVESHVCCIIYTPVGKWLYYHRGWQVCSHVLLWSLVFWGDRDEGLEADWHVACLVWETQLISTTLQGAWRGRVRSGCFVKVLSPEKPVDIPLLDGASCHCSTGGGGSSEMGSCGEAQDPAEVEGAHWPGWNVVLEQRCRWIWMDMQLMAALLLGHACLHSNLTHMDMLLCDVLTCASFMWPRWFWV